MPLCWCACATAIFNSCASSATTIKATYPITGASGGSGSPGGQARAIHHMRFVWFNSSAICCSFQASLPISCASSCATALVCVAFRGTYATPSAFPRALFLAVLFIVLWVAAARGFEAAAFAAEVAAVCAVEAEGGAAEVAGAVLPSATRLRARSFSSASDRRVYVGSAKAGL